MIDLTAPCPKCGFYRDTPNHVFGCKAAEVTLGHSPECTNPWKHRETVDCWTDVVLPFEEPERLCKMCNEKPCVYLLCDDCVFREMTQEEEL